MGELKTRVSAGEVGRETMVWQPGMADWCMAQSSPLALLFDSPPPLAAGRIDNKFIWMLALAPIAYAIFENWLPTNTKNAGFVTFIAATVCNTALAYFDQRILKRAGYNYQYLILAAFFLVPVYLWVRATRTKQEQYYFFVWFFALLMSLFV